MSNSIWKTPDEKPEDGATVAFYLEDSMGSGDYDYDENEILVNCGFIKFSRITKWAYLTDLISQADNAERLQKAVENSREKLAVFMHDVWGNWFAHQLNNSTVENLQRWGIQSNLPYSSLTESDKDKDRKFADRIIEIIKAKSNN